MMQGIGSADGTPPDGSGAADRSAAEGAPKGREACVAWLRERGAVVCAVDPESKAPVKLPRAKGMEPPPENYWTDPRVQAKAAAGPVTEKHLIVPATLPRPAFALDHDRARDGSKLTAENAQGEYEAVLQVMQPPTPPSLKLPTSKPHRSHSLWDLDPDAAPLAYGQKNSMLGCDTRCAKGYVVVHSDEALEALVASCMDDGPRAVLPVAAVERLYEAGAQARGPKEPSKKRIPKPKNVADLATAIRELPEGDRHDVTCAMLLAAAVKGLVATPAAQEIVIEAFVDAAGGDRGPEVARSECRRMLDSAIQKAGAVRSESVEARRACIAGRSSTMEPCSASGRSRRRWRRRRTATRGGSTRP